MDEMSARQQIVDIARRCAAKGFFESTDGNISCRLQDGRVLVTPAGICKAGLTPEALILTNLDGEAEPHTSGSRPTSELAMHLHVYRHRPDIRAVLHAHPPFATALSVAGLPFQDEIIPETLMVLGEVPTAAYARPGTPAMGEVLTPDLLRHDNFLLSHHGTLCLAESVERALINLERMEHTARVYFIASQMGGAKKLPASEIEQLRKLYARK